MKVNATDTLQLLNITANNLEANSIACHRWHVSASDTQIGNLRVHCLWLENIKYKMNKKITNWYIPILYPLSNFSALATLAATTIKWPKRASSSSTAADTPVIGFRGITKKWTGADGLTSLNARACYQPKTINTVVLSVNYHTLSSSYIMLAGISLRTIFAKIVSSPGAGADAAWALAASSDMLLLMRISFEVQKVALWLTTVPETILGKYAAKRLPNRETNIFRKYLQEIRKRSHFTNHKTGQIFYPATPVVSNI